ncbi:MAG TPA: c-type cytochrome [Gemmatimonadales bacterium]
MTSRVVPIGIVLVAVLVAASFGQGVPRSHAQDLENGKALYDKWCAGCHGDTGAGDGEAAAYMLPRPRDFTRGLYQIRTTASGELPTDADLRAVIDEGMPGTAMPGWKTRLSSGDRDDVIAYIKSFSAFFEGASPQPMAFGKAPGRSDEGLAEGARVYREMECFKCHGDAGRGDGPSAPTMTDDWDHPIRPADLTRPWTFNGGGAVADIYRRMRTGLDATPMPSFSDAIDAAVVTEEQLWRVAQFVRSLGPEQPEVREVIRAVRLSGAMPADPTDSLWGSIEPQYIPMVGQIVRAPRTFAPAVDGLWVRAVHDGTTLAMLVTWSDPSASPDAAWQEWLDRLSAVMQDADGVMAAVQGPDRLAIQFPARPSEGMQRPYFLGGDSRRPVYSWRWSSTPDQLTVGTASGLDQFVAGASEVAHVAAFDAGQWSIQITRSLAPADATASPTFAEGEAIPIAFQVADGSSGETGIRGSVSAWYAIYLDVPTPPAVFVAPVLAALFTAGLGILLVVRAQRREGGA